MGLGRAIEAAIDDRRGEPGVVEAEADGAKAEVEVLEADRLGVRVSRVRVTRAEPFDLEEEAAELPERLRSLPERMTPVEIDKRLGGGRFRTDPDEIVDREFFELDLKNERELDLRRLRAGDNGREVIDWTMTRRQLRGVLDELE